MNILCTFHTYPYHGCLTIFAAIFIYNFGVIGGNLSYFNRCEFLCYYYVLLLYIV